MNQKERYVSDQPVPEHHHSITVGGKRLNVNQEVTLERGIGYPAGRYRFCYAEQHDGDFMLMFFGPTRRTKQRYREVWYDGAAVRTVHHE